jgi:hypothetical protein
MKYALVFTLVLATFSVLASPVNVQIVNNGNFADLQIYNTTEFEVSCSGTVITDLVTSGRTSFQTVYPDNSSEPISYVSESISCFDVR